MIKLFLSIAAAILIACNICAQIQTVTYKIDSMFYSGYSASDTVKRKTPFTSAIFAIVKKKYVTDIVFVGNKIREELVTNTEIPKPLPRDCYGCSQPDWGEFVFKNEEESITDSVQIGYGGYHLIGTNGIDGSFLEPIVEPGTDNDSFGTIELPIDQDDFISCSNVERLILNKDFCISKKYRNNNSKAIKANLKSVKPAKSVQYMNTSLDPILDTKNETARKVGKDTTNVSFYHDDPIVSIHDSIILLQVQPKFPGNINMWLASNIVYPEQARDANIHGTVFMSFIVERDGSVDSIKVIGGVNNYLDDEAKRVIGEMPKWSPGKKNGQTVRVKYMLPIHFILN